MRLKPQISGVSLRPFPYPFRAALALCSDIDGCDRPTFLKVHRLLNDPQEGLGLPVADSFFPVGREPGQLSLFLPDGRTPGPDAELILSALRSGLIDSLHSWGDFNGCPPNPAKLRNLAESCTDLLLGEGLPVRVWINHGDPLNRQNLPARLQPGYSGDDPASPFYTADLVGRLGVKFAWCSELRPWPLSPGRPRLAKILARLAGNTGKNLVKLILGRWRQRRLAASVTRLCQPATLADGGAVLAFTRFNRHPQGLWGRPTRHTLRYALHPRVLQDLLDEEGYLVVYAHLGLPRDGDEEVFPEPDRQALLNLSRHYQSGRLWVAPTSRLLTFWLMQHFLNWEAIQKGDRLIIDLKGLDDPTTGRRRPRPEEVAGLCFYSPRPEAAVLRLDGRELAAQIYPADHTGQRSLGLPPALPPGLAGLEDQ
jgi:hypothetical protein